MKSSDVRAMTVDQLDDEFLKLKKERFNLRFQRATGQLENTARVRQVRRDIARLKTIARQKRAGAPAAAVVPPPPPQPAEPKVKAKPKATAEAKPKRAPRTKSKSKDK